MGKVETMAHQADSVSYCHPAVAAAVVIRPTKITERMADLVAAHH
jgi:hypothetical protein